MSKGRIINLAVAICLVILLSGCAANIKYAVDKKPEEKPVAHNYVVLIDIIDDERPPEEHTGKMTSDTDYMYTKDKNFKAGIDAQISQMLAEHLAKSRIVRTVEVKNVDNDLDKNTAEMEALHNQGVDLVIIADLKHFYGYQNGANTAMMAGVLGGLVGAFTEMIVNPKNVGGNVEYCNIKIISLHNKEILWSGDINHKFQDKDVFYDGQVNYALQALKGANAKVIVKLDEVLDSYQENGVNTPGIIEPKEPVPAKISSEQNVASYSEYYRLLYRTISGRIVKPQGSGSGLVDAAFTLNSSGALEDVSILDGSTEDAALRNAVENAIRESSPFPEFPPDIKPEGKKTFTISIEFRG
jgi:TonB family protein